MKLTALDIITEALYGAEQTQPNMPVKNTASKRRERSAEQLDADIKSFLSE